MTEHPITPPPELWLWAQQAQRMDPHDPVAWMQHVSAQAAQWGADQELEACCKWITEQDWTWTSAQLRAARRPKPPSLKEQALGALYAIATGADDTREFHQDLETIKTALEQLND